MAGRGQSPSFMIMPSIDRESRVPPSQQIANDLRDRIASGEIPPGRRIPSLTELEQEWDVARDTLRKAVGILRAEGLVETVQGLGVFVRDADE